MKANASSKELSNCRSRPLLILYIKMSSFRIDSKPLVDIGNITVNCNLLKLKKRNLPSKNHPYKQKHYKFRNKTDSKTILDK